MRQWRHVELRRECGCPLCVLVQAAILQRVRDGWREVVHAEANTLVTLAVKRPLQVAVLLMNLYVTAVIERRHLTAAPKEAHCNVKGGRVAPGQSALRRSFLRQRRCGWTVLCDITLQLALVTWTCYLAVRSYSTSKVDVATTTRGIHRDLRYSPWVVRRRPAARACLGCLVSVRSAHWRHQVVLGPQIRNDSRRVFGST